jgi:hypothetical protein
VRRSVFDSLGGFPDVPFLEDWLFSKLLREHGRLVVLPGPLLVSARRWKRSGLVRQTLRNWSILWRASRGVPIEQLASEYQSVP